MPEIKIGFKDFKSICRAMLSYDDVKLLCAHISGAICAAFGVKGCSVLLYDAHERQLFRVASWGISAAYLNKGPLFVDERYAAFATGQPLLIQDFQNDPRVQYPEAAEREGIASMLSIPIRHRDAPLGLVRIYHSEPWNSDAGDLDSFGLMAGLMGIVIENNGLRNFIETVTQAVDGLPLRLMRNP